MDQDYKELTKLIKQIDKNIRKYEEQNKNLPRGTIFIRKINKKSYVYRNRKECGKVISEYLGVYGDPHADEEIKKSKLYKNGVLNIRRLRKQLEHICKKASKNKDNDEDLTKFAININRVDGITPDKDAITILKLFEKGLIDSEAAEKALIRLSYVKE